MARFISLVALLCVVAAVSANPIFEDLIEPHAQRDQSLIVGNCQGGIRLIHTEKIDVKSATLQIKKHNFSYTNNNNQRINCLKVIDQLRSGGNAAITVNSGGPNFTFAVVNFKSKRGGPINYVVEVYA